jgi:D-arabinose 1-dehydrogenase-like Zn-dependent alcohol dehydrogenase
MAFAYDGAWAEYTVAQAVGLTRVPDNVPLEQAAILADAVSTPPTPHTPTDSPMPTFPVRTTAPNGVDTA